MALKSAVALVAAATFMGIANGSIYPDHWYITNAVPANGATYHTTDTITISSDHTATFHRVPAGFQNDSCTVWGKNGYSSTLVGSETDAHTWLPGPPDEFWTTNVLHPHGNVTISTQGNVTVWFKTTYKANNMTNEALMYDTHGNNAYIEHGITIIQ